MSVGEQKPETSKAYNRYLASLGIDTTYSFQIVGAYYDSLSTEKYAVNTYKLKTGAKASPVQLRVYDNKGNLINGYEQCFGNLSKLGILETMPPKQIAHLPVNYKLSLQKDVNLLNADISKKNALLIRSYSVDYTVFVFYAEWAGRYAKEVLKEINTYIQKHSESRFHFIKVNTAPPFSTVSLLE